MIEPQKEIFRARNEYQESRVEQVKTCWERVDTLVDKRVWALECVRSLTNQQNHCTSGEH